MTKLADLYNQPESNSFYHEIEQPLSEYALQDLKDICKPFKVEVKQEVFPKHKAIVYFIGKNAQL